jgi:hypothetical protein
MAETTYEMLQNMSVGELLTEAASVGNDEIEAKINELMGDYWHELDGYIARLADQINARNKRLWEESITEMRADDDGLDYCF